MKIGEILAKIAKGEELTAEERKFVAEYKPDEAAKIPKERLDKEIEKRNSAEKSLEQAAAQIEELKTKLEELQNAGMSEAEKAKAENAKQLAKLTAQVGALTKERDEAAKKAALLEFSNAVKDIAGKHRFSDSEYLGYRLQSAGVKLDDDEAVTEFMRGLEQSSPNLFESAAKGGTGTNAGGQNVNHSDASKSRLAELVAKTELSNREVAEVISLQDQISRETKN